MHKLIALYAPPENPEQFKNHLLEVHLPLVRAFPGLQGLRVGFDVACPSGPSRYFAVVECDFADEAAMHAALLSKEGQAASADVPNYAGAGFTIITFPVQTL